MMNRQQVEEKYSPQNLRKPVPRITGNAHMQTRASFQPIASATTIAMINVLLHEISVPSVAPEMDARWVVSVDRNEVRAPVEF